MAFERRGTPPPRLRILAVGKALHATGLGFRRPGLGEARPSQVARPVYAGFGSFTVGQALGMPISDAYQPPFKFTGVLEQVRVELTPPVHNKE